jgi:hypothetical protein
MSIAPATVFHADSGLTCRFAKEEKIDEGAENRTE